jgi:hypothetical protein
MQAYGLKRFLSVRKKSTKRHWKHVARASVKKIICENF